MPADNLLFLVGITLLLLSLLIYCFVFLRSDYDHFPVGASWAVMVISIMGYFFTTVSTMSPPAKNERAERKRIEYERGKINCLASLEYLKSKGRDTSGLRCE